MVLDLIDNWLDFAVRKQIEHILSIKVADAQMFRVAPPDALFHVLPDVTDLAVSPLPLAVKAQSWNMEVV